MSPVAAVAPSTAGRLVSALGVVVLGGLLVFGGLRFLQFEMMRRDVDAALSGEFWRTQTLQSLRAFEPEIQSWRDTPGLRAPADQLWLRLGRATGLVGLKRQGDVVRLIGVAPTDPDAWLQLAISSWAASNRPLAYDAWRMAALLAPRERGAVFERLALMLPAWLYLPDDLKKQILFEINMNSETGKRFAWAFGAMLKRVPQAARAQFEADWAAFGKPAP